jgi:hypothetical protein
MGGNEKTRRDELQIGEKHHFSCSRRNCRIFTEPLLLANNKEYGPHFQEAAVGLVWQNIATKKNNKSACDKPASSKYSISDKSKINY